MGGRHKKFVRKEKSKVKLKAKKTVLTKAKNVTDTNFKVRKIVLREQLKTVVLEVQTKRKLNVRELLSKLHHYNSSVRKSNLEGLQQLVMHHSEDILDMHLAGLIEGTARLILDEEKDVRKSALKLLSFILTQVPVSRVLPFFSVLLNYLNCAMTHIHTSIQDDSLAMLDTMLVSTPQLVAANTEKILCNFLDMISSVKADSTSGRTLNVNLSSRFTSVMWRMKVLRRLKSLLSAMVAYKSQQGKKCFGLADDSSANTAFSHVSCSWKNDSELHIPIYNKHYRDICYLPNVFSAGSSSYDSSIEDRHLQEYVKVVMPLLLETWREVAAGHVGSIGVVQESCSLLSVEAAEILNYVLEIIQLLCELLMSEATEFITAHKQDFTRLFFHGFPYSCSQRYEEGKKDRKEMKKQKCMTIDPRCLSQNLAICHIFYYFCDDHNVDAELSRRMLKYVKDSIRNWKDQDDKQQLMQVLRHILQCMKCWDCHGRKLRKVLDRIVTCYTRTHEHNLFELLSDLALSPDHTYIYRCASFQNWLESLPELLSSPTVPSTTVEVLTRLACRNNPLFYKGLCQKVPDILNNLNSVRVIGADNEREGRKSIINILYWVKDWSRDGLTTLNYHLHSEDCDKDLASHIVDLLASRKSRELEPNTHQQ